MNTKNLLKAFLNYYQEQLKIIICLLPFCLLLLVLLPKPANAYMYNGKYEIIDADECQCLPTSLYHSSCYIVGTQNECEPK
jgi:hypothetical protein